ncbi:MAG TPA: ParB/Srx family N-terminal domain-containing protein [Aggregatilineales bacterium]|nr:ParB/Srx family N-terminal domain-containing protein [Aggregatilineales bacterium]
MTWLSRFLSQSAEDKKQKMLKSFEEETAHLHIEAVRKPGIVSIEIDKIVGSVGRAHELDKNFHYRKRAKTERYHIIEDAMRSGKPMEPVKVFKLKRGRETSEYYVVDGHHRVAQAKQHGYTEINADVTEVIILDDETTSHVPAAVENDG